MAENKMMVRVIAPERVFYEGEASFLEFNTIEGIIGRTYIELSKDVNSVDGTTREDDAVVNTVKDTYAYHPTDYNPEMPDIDSIGI